MSTEHGFFAELKRRNVFKVGAAYGVMAWLLAQGLDLFLENFGAPAWVIKTVLLLLVAGFPLALFFAWAFELTPEGIKKEKDVDRSQSITHQTGRKLDFLIIGILVVALGYFAFDKFEKGSEKGSEPFSSADSSAGEGEAEKRALTPFQTPPAPPAKSIAVLPFVNMSDDAGNEYFSDGISEEILNALAQVPELQVAGRTSSFAFKGNNEDLRKIGEALGVSHILEGSVRKSGTKVRITAQLIRVDNGFHLWSESYDRELTDVFAIQDEIANAILVQLKAHLVEGAPQVVATKRTNTEAYDLYLLAKQRMYERSRLPLEAAAEMLDRAIAIDPGYAPAYAQRGIVTDLLSETEYGAIPKAQVLTQSKQFVDQALKLDPELAEGWAALGLYYQNLPGGTEQSIAALEKALSINPNLIEAANWLGNAYNDNGQPAKNLTVLEDLIRRDPLFKPAVGNLTFLYIQMGQRDKAQALIEKTRPFLAQDANVLDWDSTLLATAGEFAAALPLSEEAVRQQPQDRVYRSGMSVALLATHQYERIVKDGYWIWKVRALKHLKRVEEATQLAQQWAAQGDIRPYLNLLSTTGQFEALVSYVEEHWPDLGAFAADFPAAGYFGYGMMNDLALAYRRTGNQEKFNDAMARVRAAHDALAAQGLSNPIFFTNEAAYYAMADDRGQALKFLAAAVDGGQVFSARITDDLPFFADFEGDPEYEAIQKRMLEHVNRERTALGLEPVTT
jgi:TolB-like protein